MKSTEPLQNDAYSSQAGDICFSGVMIAGGASETSESDSERVCPKEGVKTQSAPASLLRLGLSSGADEITKDSGISLCATKQQRLQKMSFHDGQMTSNGAARLEGMKVQDPSTPTRKPPKPENAITIAVSSRVLFTMDLEQQVFEQKGMEEYLKYQIEHETEPFAPGPAFPFVKALEAVNVQLRQLYPDSDELFDVVLMTNHHANVGLRLINSINHHKLFIERFCMTGGNSPIGYLKAYHTNLYLSADSKKVMEALEAGIAAATMFKPEKAAEVSETQLRVAFDGDAVLFSDESERIFKTQGLDKFFEHEKAHENKLLDHGPLKGFLEALGKLQKKFSAKGQRMDCPIRTYLVTARSAASSGTRALKTLRSWGLETDEALFLAGAPKGPMLAKIKPHIFFDDQMFHIEGAAELGTVGAHVPYGVAQKVP